MLLQVLIEAGSASSFELSPRFLNQISGGGHGHHAAVAAAASSSSRHSGSKEQVHDVESELQEAMADLAEESLLDGECYCNLNFHTLNIHYKDFGRGT